MWISGLALILATQTTPLADDFGATWDIVNKRISTSYYARETRKDEMVKRLGEAEPKAKAAKTRHEFTETVNEMINGFGDSHFEFLPNMSQGYFVFDALFRGDRAEPMPHIGAWIRKEKDGYSAQMVLNGGAAEKAGLRNGDRLVQIGDTTFSPIEALTPNVGKSVKLTWTRANATMSGEVEVKSENGLNMFLQATKDSIKTIDRGGKKYGYIHLWTQANANFRNVLNSAITGPFAATDGMILDLRDGFGGTPGGFGDPWWSTPATETEPAKGYDKPLVVIINKGSRSAKEVLSRSLQRSGRAKLIGENTAGAVLGTTPIRVNDWSYIEIPIVSVSFAGENLEKKGVAPDIRVRNWWTKDGKDNAIESALKTLESMKDWRWTKGRPAELNPRYGRPQPPTTPPADKKPG